jgi:hypothetical protein
MIIKPKRQIRRLPVHVEREIAVAAKTDPRTVANVVAGRPTRAATRERIEAALLEHEGDATATKPRARKS